MQTNLEKKPYSVKNPPANVEQAQERTGELQMSIEQIRSSLQTITEDSYTDAASYKDWHRRAAHSLGYKKAELRFLSDWLRKETGRTKQVESARKKGDLMHVARQLCNAIGYTQQFSAQNPPASIGEIDKRRAGLSETKRSIESAFRDITTTSYEMGTGRSAYLSAKKIISTVLLQLESEMAFLGMYKKQLLEQAGQKARLVGIENVGKMDFPATSEYTWAISEEMAAVKEALGMKPAQMVAWLHDLLIRNQHLLRLSTEESNKLALFTRYVCNHRKLSMINPQRV
jgi:hypothetical protein